mgnify:FL=1
MRTIRFIENLELEQGVCIFFAGDIVEIDDETDDMYVVQDRFGYTIGLEKVDDDIVYMVMEECPAILN